MGTIHPVIHNTPYVSNYNFNFIISRSYYSNSIKFILKNYQHLQQHLVSLNHIIQYILIIHLFGIISAIIFLYKLGTKSVKLFCVEEGDVVSRKGFCRVGWRLQYLTHVRALCPLILDHMAPNQPQLYILGHALRLAGAQDAQPSLGPQSVKHQPIEAPVGPPGSLSNTPRIVSGSLSSI